MITLMAVAEASTLFIDDAPLEPSGGPFAGVVLEMSIDRALDYSIPKKLLNMLQVGQQVKVPLGRKNKLVRGYVVSILPTTTHPKVKDVAAIEDERVLVDERLMRLARWMSRYYCCPLGSVIETIIPAAVKKQIGMGYTQWVRLVKERDEVQSILEKTRAPKRRAILARLLLLEPGAAIELTRLASEGGATAATVRKLVRLGIITIRPQVDLPKLTAMEAESTALLQEDLPLNDDQRVVCERLIPRVMAGLTAGQFSVNLLHGVTGSGKTEVYLHAIRKAVEQGRQALLLVPEIALTPQAVQRFTARFRRVAILHSGLSATERHRFWQRIAEGRADVVVGARSAVFAPVPKLGIIVVDEEHESSYKSDTAPRYHGRDVAIKRAQLEGIAIILGSATPSLETYVRARRLRTADAMPPRNMGVPPMPATCEEKELSHSTSTSPARPGRPCYEATQKPAGTGPGTGTGTGTQLVSDPETSCVPVSVPPDYFPLPHRVRGLAMPHVELVDMRTQSRMRRGINLISQRLEYLLRNTIDQGQQAILLLNRRGYSNFVFCSSCQEPLHCKYCDTTMTYHRSAGVHAHGATNSEAVHTGQMHCHYCLAVNPLPPKCPACSHKLSLFGLGTQRVEEELARKFPGLAYARVDSDTMRGSRDYERLLTQFGSGAIKVMLGTQMIAKGLDYPNVTLVGVISGDTALSLPDFRAAERTFQLITQVAGRAGRGDAPGRVVLQTFVPDDPTIRAALKQDYAGFAKTELAARRELNFPPYSRMVRIILRDQELEKLTPLADELAGDLRRAIGDRLVYMRGPMPCAISRIAGYFRSQILMTSARASLLQEVLAEVRRKGSLGKTDRIAVDVDPVSLL
jgi:primosomal protein N' (replication factor Y) (superfamily II helicase)